MPGSPAQRLQARLALSDDELLAVLGEDALSVLTGEADLRPDVRLLASLVDACTAEDALLARWTRSRGPTGRPLDALLARDFARFEDQLEQLAQRGFVLRGGG